MRLFSSIIAGLATFAFAATASAALIIDVQSDVDPTNLLPGDEVTLTITLSTTNVGEARGLTLRAAGLGDLTFVSATAPNTASSAGGAIFGAPQDTVIPAVGTFPIYSNFIANVNSGPVDNGTDVVLFNGVTTSDTTGAGPEVWTLTLLASAAGAGAVEIGAIEAFGDAYVSAVDGTSRPTQLVAYNVIPEPGTALLMGLGLAGLAAAGRRE